MKKILVLTVLLAGLSSHSLFAFDKIPYHIGGVVVGDALGGYSSVMAIMYGQSDWTKAAGIVNLGLMAAGSTWGILTLSGVGEYSDMVVVHKIIGYTIFAASVWLSVSATMDDGLKRTAAPYTSYGYTVVSAVPIIFFSINF